MTNPSVPSVGVNAYISAKRVTRVPNNAHGIGMGNTNGTAWTAALDDGDHPALLLRIFREGAPEPVLLRLDFARLVASLIAAEAAEAGTWELLVETEGPHGPLWVNSIITASVNFYEQKDGSRMAYINYHRNDRAPIRDWRIGQRIKNQLAGPDWEGVELYPAEDRVVDTSNEYHLYAFDGRLPFGFSQGERATQAQLDEHLPPGFGEGPVQTDDPDADTSSFRPINPADIYTGLWVPQEALGK